MNQIRRQQTLFQELLGAVNVGEHGIDEPDALDQPRRDLGPLSGRNHQRDRVELVGLADAANVAVNIEGRSQILDHAVGRSRHRVPLLRAPAVDFLAESLPMRPGFAARVVHFVPRSTDRHLGTRLSCGHGLMETKAFSHGFEIRRGRLKQALWDHP
jgi:hypothetical protein